MSTPDITTRAMTPEDAAAVRALMLRCYGETYFDGLYYDAEALARAIATGEQHSSIAIGPSGDVVAHLGLRCPPGSRTADSTMAIVDPQFRSRGRLGCPRCYEMFRQSLLPLLERVHDGTTHRGRCPGKPTIVNAGDEEHLIDLRSSLRDAINAENYELAARLRDQIRQLAPDEET